MRLVWGALWFVVVLLCAGLLKLLSDNILYAAIMRYLGAYGIVEGDLIAVVTTNLVPIVATIAVVALIYWMSLHHHATKSATAPAPSVVHPPPNDGLFRRFWNSGGPLPTIAISLAVAFCIGIFWQINYGPLTHLRKPQPLDALTLSTADKAERVLGLVALLTPVSRMKAACTAAKDVAENWQYRATIGGPDQLASDILPLSNAIYYVNSIDLPDILVRYKNNSEIVPIITTEWNFPDIVGSTTTALIKEIGRIKEHKGADTVFTLLNDVKLIEWKNALPQCDKWVQEKIEFINSKRAKYADQKAK
jgi:hypothetical protein